MNRFLSSKAILRSILIRQWRTVTAAIFTVALGISLAFGIRIGTGSAHKSLQKSLVSLESGGWVGPISFFKEDPPITLRYLAPSYRAIFAQKSKVLLHQDSRTKTISVPVHFIWQVTDPKATHNTSKETNRENSLTLFSVVTEALGESQDHESGGDVLGDPISNKIILVADLSCTKTLKKAHKMTLASGETFDIALKFVETGSKSCDQLFARVPEHSAQWSPNEVYLKAETEEAAHDLRNHLKNLLAQVYGLEYRDASEQIADLSTLTESMQINLQLMGFVSLFIGIFMVNHVLSILIMRQSQSLSIMRALGIPFYRVLHPLVLLTFGMALASGLLGAAGGVGLGRAIAFLASRTYSELYDSRIDPSAFTIIPEEFLLVFIISIVTCFVGASWPLRRLKKMAIVQTLQSGSWHDVTTRPKASNGVWLFTSTITTTGLLLAFPFYVGRQPVSAYIACFVVLLGSVLCVRPSLAWISAVIAKRSITNAFWMQFRVVFPPSSGLMVQVLILCFALAIGVRMMSSSFRASLESWVEDTLKADLWVRSKVGSDQKLPESVIATLENLKSTGVARAVDGLRVVPARVGSLGETGKGFPIVVSAVSLEAQRDAEPLRVLEYLDTETMASFYAQEGQNPIVHSQSALNSAMLNWGKQCQGIEDSPCPTYISQSLWIRLNQKKLASDKIEITAFGKRLYLEPTAVFHDFGNDSGSLLLDAPMLSRLVGRDLQPGFMNIYMIEPTPEKIEALQKQLELDFKKNLGLGETPLVEVFTGLTLRKRIMRSFEQTFAITDALYISSAIIAFFTVICSLGLQLVLRTSEWTLLWAAAWPFSKLRQRLCVWSGHMALVSCLLSVPVGIALGAILVFVVNRYAFGFILDLDIPYMFVVILLALAWISGFLGALFSTRKLDLSCQPQGLSPE